MGDISGTISWTGDNGLGNQIVPGMYIYVLKAGGGHRNTGKITIY